MSASLRTGLSKDERLRSWFDKYIVSELALRQAQGERVEGLTTSGYVVAFSVVPHYVTQNRVVTGASAASMSAR